MKTRYIVITIILIFVIGLGSVLFFVINKASTKISDIKTMIDTSANSLNRLNNIDAHRDSLIKFGEYAPAIITNIEDLNVTFNNNPKVKISLKISPKGEDQFTGECDVIVSRVQIPRVGDRVKAFYNKGNKNDITVE